jgi:hypothetical protein
MPSSGQDDRSLRERLHAAPVPGTPPDRSRMAAPWTLLIGIADDAERLALAGADPTHTMADDDAISAARGWRVGLQDATLVLK